MTFDDVLGELESRVDLPYPERALVIDELAGELDAAYCAARDQGLDEPAAREAALKALALDASAIATLEAVHLPAVRRALARLPAPLRGWVDSLAAAAPLFGFILYTFYEVPLLTFFREGGLAVWLLLALGGLAVLLELHRAVVWLVLRDHSAASLRRDTSTPLYLAAAALLVGLQGAALGYYVILGLWAEGRLEGVRLKEALREPLPNVVVATTIAALVVLLHGVIKAALRALRVPQPPKEPRT
ncbi:MAG: hypothetical protein IPJ65_42155 [Archangiaceae bacterium]|nr:hypothetical protein [Archangiaceae bacterium]